MKQTFKGDFPAEMRRMIWPLCCGFSIISGFKNTLKLSEEALTSKIISIIEGDYPDFQVYEGEEISPSMTFLTLNEEQMNSNKVMRAIAAAA